jgi:hypothetical protein
LEGVEDTLKAYFIKIPAFAYRVNTIIYNILLPLYAAAAWYFGAPKYPKRLSIRQCGFSPSHAHQKNSGTLFN